MQQEQKPTDFIQDTKTGIHWALFFFQVYSTAIEVFIHHSIGHRYLGFQALAVLMVVPLHTLFFRTNDPSMTAVFLIFYLGACILQRCGQLSRRLKGVVVHSQYNGYPWLMTERAKVSETTVKTWYEPGLIALLGLMLRQSDHANGSFLMYCAFAMCVKNLVGQHLVHEELADMNDSLIEQQHMAERFRQSRDYDRLSRR